MLSIAESNTDEDKVEKKECKDCVCLVEGKNKEWVCDELNKPIKEIDFCPER